MQAELTTANTVLKGIQDTLAQLEATALAAVPFKTGNVVKWTANGKELTGRITSLYFNRDKGYVWGKVQDNSRFYIGWSSSCYYFSDEAGSKLTVADLKPVPDFDPDTIISEKDTIEGEISELESEIDRLANPLRKKISERQHKLSECQSKCIHEWSEGYDTGEVRKHLIGETNIVEYTCEICGVSGRNC